MYNIRFSHQYMKMPDVLFIAEKPHTYLIGVSKTMVDNLPEEFKDYDTIYYEGEELGMIASLQRYPLPKGWVLVLMLFTEGHGCWTTVRRWYESKEIYYRNIIGKEVNIIIDQEPRKGYTFYGK